MTRRFRTGALALLVLGLVQGCQETGGPSTDTGGVRLQLALANVLSGESLEISPSYRRTDQSVIALEPISIALEAGASQTVTIQVDVTSCVADPAREGGGPGCPLRLTVVLRNARGDALDTQQVGPLDAVPGAVLTPSSVTLRHVETIVLAAPGATITIGTPATVSATVTDRTSTSVAGRALVWTSSNPAVATVDQAGIVTPLVPGPVTIRAVLADQPAGPQGTLNLTVISSGIAVIGPAGGTVYSRAGEITLTLPAGAVAAPTTISIQPADTVVLSRLVPGTTFDFGPDGLVLQLPATVTARYLPADIPGGAANEPVLRLFTHVPATQRYDEVAGSTVNSTAHTVTGTISHFSFYGVMIGMVGVQSIAVGSSHSCALLSSGAALCWGLNSSGQLGAGHSNPRLQAVLVLGGLTFAALGAGNGFSCGRTTAGTVYCWGTNALGQLGNGSTSDANQPQLVALPSPMQSISVGESSACAIDQSQTAWCWGRNSNSQLGVSTTATCGAVPCSPVPLSLGPSVSVTTISSGLEYRCGMSAGLSGCWGWNNQSVLGLPGATVFSQTPVPPPVGAPGAFTKLLAGNIVTCGILASGTAYCWGLGLHGSRGDGPTATSVSQTPIAVAGGLQFSMLDPARFNSVFNPSCGVTVTGDGYCWGPNFAGGLGTLAGLSTCTQGTFPPFGCTGSPVPVAGGLKFREIRTGQIHACGLTTGGEVWCWGFNFNSELGDGSLVNGFVPQRVP